MRHRVGLTLLLATGLRLAACSDDDSEPTAAPGESTATSVAPTTTITDTPATTTTPTEPAAPSVALRGDGLGVVDLGASPDAAIVALTRELGAPTVDSGWQPSFSTYGTCPGEHIRGVEWGGLVLLFTDGDTTYGSGQHLFSWRVSGAPPALSTTAGLGFGATAADAEELYPGAVETVPAEDPFPGFLEIQAEGGRLTAFLDEADGITNLEAGVPCGE